MYFNILKFSRKDAKTLSRFSIAALFFIICSCVSGQHEPNSVANKQSITPAVYDISKPYARYWWFASEIKKEDIRYNLNWLKDNGFGGVELAWVYPLNSMNKDLDTNYTPRQDWLSPEWHEIVTYAIHYADSIGLGCDLTMGTLWPFGDSYVSYEEAAQTFGHSERQKITRSWEYPKHGYVIDHINPDNYLPYFKRIIDSFPQPITKLSKSYFVDSWEVETNGLWTDGFKEEFEKRYGYDISPYMDDLYKYENGHYRYDYMKLISEKVIGFYHDFDSVLNRNGICSRGQCSGAPCDVLSAYARLDIPEGEAMLYEPEYNSIPASAALLSSKKVVSAETFTCLYGWPRNYIREEQTADLKLVADALFANGINHIIWHGKAHNPVNYDSVNFYASVHIGDDGTLAGEIPQFNKYLEKVSGYMKKGKTYSDVAVYLPFEDAWMKGKMPVEKQFRWAWGFYEMRYVYFPKEVRNHHPVWINKEFLQRAKLIDGQLHIGDARFNSLYADVNYMDYDALQIITELAEKGFPVTLDEIPAQPGTRRNKNWDNLINKLNTFPNATSYFKPPTNPLIEGDPPPYWARETEDALYLFFSNPKSERLTFPIVYGQSHTTNTVPIPITINYKGNSYPLTLEFEPYQSLLYKIENDSLHQIDIEFIPKTPQKGQPVPRKDARWLVGS